MHMIASRGIIVAFLLALAACRGGSDRNTDGGGDPTSPSTLTVASVTIAGASTVDVGRTVTLSATARDASSNALSGKSFTWSSDNATVATVGADGVVTGRALGTATVSATADGRTGTQTITVTNPVAAVTIGGTFTARVGATTALAATAHDAAGIALTGLPTAWTSSDAAIATVSADGVVTGVRAGTATISATTLTRVGTATVTVTPAPPSLVITGATTLQAGATTRLTATADGNAITGQPIVWSSSDPTMMTVAPDGTVSAVRIGSATITASSGDRSGSLTLTSALAPYTFVFQGGTAADQQLIRDAVQQAHFYFASAFGRTIQAATTIVGSVSSPGCANPSSAAHAFAGTVMFCITNTGWTQVGPLMKTKIAVHEVFHLLQFEVGWISTPAVQGPVWFLEGAAEFVGFSALADRGQLPLATSRGCNRRAWSNYNNAGVPLAPLSALESPQQWQTTPGPKYTAAFIGVDQLQAGAGGIGSLRTFWTRRAAGDDWQTAFQSAFNTSVSSFYAQFPGYSSALPVPTSYLCSV